MCEIEVCLNPRNSLELLVQLPCPATPVSRQQLHLSRGAASKDLDPILVRALEVRNP